jgi:hypothetical protein
VVLAGALLAGNAGRDVGPAAYADLSVDGDGSIVGDGDYIGSANLTRARSRPPPGAPRTTPARRWPARSRRPDAADAQTRLVGQTPTGDGQ